MNFNPLNAELNPIRHLLALVGARHIVDVSRIRVKKAKDRKNRTKAYRYKKFILIFVEEPQKKEKWMELHLWMKFLHENMEFEIFKQS
jgi:hypothetical protein